MLEQVQSSEPPSADTRAIERELVELWRQAGTPEAPMCRSRVMSLVAVAPAGRESAMADCLVQLAERHPARALLLLLDGGATDEEALAAEVTLLCGVKARSLCAEQIRLRAGAGARWRLPSAVRALLSANLPVVLWWNLPPETDSTLYEQLAALADRVLLDSATLWQGDHFHPMAERWWAPRHSDLNWERLTGWRELVAQFFDAPEHRAYLAQLESVTIRSGPSRVGSFLLAGWLASRLNWTIVDASLDELRFRSETGRDVTVRLEIEPQAETVRGMTLRAGAARFAVRRADDVNARCTLDLPDGTRLQQVVTFQSQSEAALVSRELDLMRQSRIYKEAALVVQALLEEI